MIFAWFAFGFVTAVAAARKGKSVPGWFVLGMIFGPFALIAILLASPYSPRPSHIGRDDTQWPCAMLPAR